MSDDLHAEIARLTGDLKDADEYARDLAARVDKLEAENERLRERYVEAIKSGVEPWVRYLSTPEGEAFLAERLPTSGATG